MVSILSHTPPTDTPIRAHHFPPQPALGEWPSTDEEDEQQLGDAGAAPQHFALSTMEEDGQAWMCEELGHTLVGLQYSTPRAKVVTTQLLGYEGGLVGTSKGTSRCGDVRGGPG